MYAIIAPNRPLLQQTNNRVEHRVGHFSRGSFESIHTNPADAEGKIGVETFPSVSQHAHEPVIQLPMWVRHRITKSRPEMLNCPSIAREACEEGHISRNRRGSRATMVQAFDGALVQARRNSV
jgi:hypothetical protein